MGRIVNGYPILPNGRTCNGNGTIVNINARTTYNNGMGNMGLFGAHNVRTNYAPTMDPYAFMAQQNACYDCGGGGNKFMNGLMGVLGFLGVAGGVVSEILGGNKETKETPENKDTTPTQQETIDKLSSEKQKLEEIVVKQEEQIEQLEESENENTSPIPDKVKPEEQETETEPKVEDKPSVETKPTEDPEAAKKAKAAKEKAEAEALEKEGITKTKDGKYQMSFYNQVTGKLETVTANSVNEVKAQHKKGMQAADYQKEQLMNEHGIQENNGRYSYQFTVPYDKNIHSIEFTSLSMIEAVLQEAERIKNR